MFLLAAFNKDTNNDGLVTETDLSSICLSTERKTAPSSSKGCR